jgi:hypothetical protein
MNIPHTDESLCNSVLLKINNLYILYVSYICVSLTRAAGAGGGEVLLYNAKNGSYRIHL